MTWDLLLLFFLPISIGVLSIFTLIPIGQSIGLVDYPGHRKHHAQPTITTGGLSIYVTVLICAMFLLPKEPALLVYFVCSSMLMVLGIVDDIVDIPPIQRLIAQSFIALLMCTQGDMYIASLGELLGFGHIDLSYFGYPLTVIAVIAAINAFNMIDGIDGLLGSTALIIFSALSFLFILAGDMYHFKFSLLIAISIVPYLWANLQLKPVWLQKIFMGDAGSMLIGFSVVWLLVQATQGSQQSFSVTTALWLICFPLMDMVRVMMSRKLRGKSMLEADRTHLHHLLTDNVAVKQRVLMMINTFSLLAVATGVVLEVTSVPEVMSLLLFVSVFGVYVYSVYKVLEVPFAGTVRGE